MESGRLSSSSPLSNSLLLFGLTGPRVFRTARSFDTTAHIDVVAVLVIFQGVEVTLIFG